MQPVEEQLQTIDAKTLTDLVRKAKDNPFVEVVDWSFTNINPRDHYLTVGIFRFTGIARTKNQRQPWSLILKVTSTLSHQDTDRRNLFTRLTAGGQEQTVAIDWGLLGLAAVGEDLGDSRRLQESHQLLADLPQRALHTQDGGNDRSRLNQRRQLLSAAPCPLIEPRIYYCHRGLVDQSLPQLDFAWSKSAARGCRE